MKRLVLFLLGAAIIALPLVTAQMTGPQTPTTYTVVSFGPAGPLISSKQHAPFSAVLTQQVQQTLNDGVNISRDDEEVVMRDGMGRIYRARTIKRLGNNEREPAMMITITDPVQHVQYVCNSFRRGCRKMAYRPPSPMHPTRRVAPQKQKDMTVEELGSSNISGIDVEGRRVTREIREGEVGNDRPFTTTEELWHSNELDVDVQVKRTDPRAGTRTTTLTEIRVGEPDSSYFRVPEGYRVDEMKGPMGGLSPLQTESESSYPAGTMPPHR